MDVASSIIEVQTEEEREPLLKQNQQDQQRKDNSARRRRNLLKRCTHYFYIGQWPVLLIITWSLIANFFTVLPGGTESDKSSLNTIILSISLGVNGAVLFLYPFLGWLADAYITHYWAVGASLYLILLGMVAAIALSAVSVFFPLYLQYLSFWVAGSVALGTALLGNGIFSATAIQLGTDQMLEASSEQLSSFIHWYYWTTKLGSVLVYYMIIIVSIVIPKLLSGIELQYFTLLLAITQVMLTTIGIVTFHASRHHMYVQVTRNNPVSTIYQVLRYTWKHKLPEKRSALTYWEEDTPARIDLGKTKYGGPFSTEEVEDTKSFLRILLLLASLFGLRAVEDTGNMLDIHTPQNSTLVQFLVTKNTDYITEMTIILMIPIYQLFIKPLLNNYTPSMLKRFWFGLFCGLVSSLFTLIILTINECDIGNTVSIVLLSCIVISDILNGLADILVFLTGLEFIIAQAPHSMQGLLIGLWYAMDLVRISLDAVDLTTYGNIMATHITRSCITLVSLLMYSIAVCFYKYRDRDNIVDAYNLVAGKIERAISHRVESRQTTSDVIVMSVSDNSSINSHNEDDSNNFNALFHNFDSTV